jgi:alkanesulfonate monooxygenase SsuD/methylene tetrahydromethanopterin reductase-like flavin-dependent oxidoreductase (luciferase family)
MRIGLTLPSFRDDSSAVAAAVEAERLGFDGVFAFDHLWPMGQPQRPALSVFPLLGAVAASTERITVGTLVARIGLLPDELLVRSLRSLDRIAAGRFIAGLGVGDSKSKAENEAFGIRFAPVEDRLASLEACATRLRDDGVTVWVGAARTDSPTSLIAERLGGTVNFWQVSPEDLARARDRLFGEVTWGGMVGRTPSGNFAGTADKPPEIDAASATEHLKALAAAGATWAVCVWPTNMRTADALAEAASRLHREVSG